MQSYNRCHGNKHGIYPFDLSETFASLIELLVRSNICKILKIFEIIDHKNIL